MANVLISNSNDKDKGQTQRPKQKENQGKDLARPSQSVEYMCRARRVQSQEALVSHCQLKKKKSLKEQLLSKMYR